MSRHDMEVRDASPAYDQRATNPAVPAGYKQTEVGVIPEDWDVWSLRQTSRGIYRGASPRPIGDNRWFDERSEIGWVRISDVTRSRRYLLSTTQQLSDEGVTRSRFIPRGSLIMSICATVGRPIETAVDTCIHDGFVVFDKPKLDQGFLYHILCDLEPRWSDKGQTGSQMNLNTNLIKNTEIPVPPTTKEQRAIAIALSDVDALLEALDHLIAKKRDLKQATIQQLLTGQTRLPGFEGEWETIRLGDHVTFLKNGTNARAELVNDGELRYLHYGDIHASVTSTLEPFSLPYLPIAKAKTLGRLRDGDLVFADASEDMEGVGKSVELINVGPKELVGGLHTIAARFDKSILADGFKAYLQFCPEFVATLRQLAAGTKVYAITRSHIAGIEMRLPKVEEQRAIAAIFHDMDVEIEALSKRRAKTTALKQAMMQELLTGRVRLIEIAGRNFVEKETRPNGRKANVYFMRSVLAAEIVDQLHAEPTFGHVKFEKMLFLVEHLCDVDTGSSYHRQAAGPYDNRALRSIDSQLRKQQWFDACEDNGRYRYMPLQKRGGHKHYFDRYFFGVATRFNEIMETFRALDTERCEIVATLFSAWSDLLGEKGDVSDKMIVHEVLNNWHESKQRISKDRWLNALVWMREKGFVPKGATA